MWLLNGVCDCWCVAAPLPRQRRLKHRPMIWDDGDDEEAPATKPVKKRPAAASAASESEPPPKRQRRHKCAAEATAPRASGRRALRVDRVDRRSDKEISDEMDRRIALARKQPRVFLNKDVDPNVKVERLEPNVITVGSDCAGLVTEGLALEMLGVPREHAFMSEMNRHVRHLIYSLYVAKMHVYRVVATGTLPKCQGPTSMSSASLANRLAQQAREKASLIHEAVRSRNALTM